MPAKQGLIFGKFYPFHKGHQLLVDRALDECDELIVAVSFRSDETIPQKTRADWIRNYLIKYIYGSYPSPHPANKRCRFARVIELPSTLPYFIHDCPTPETFYNIWTDVLTNVCGRIPDVTYTSEPEYDRFVSGYLKSEHVIVDTARELVPVSGTAIRNDPFENWKYMSPHVRSYFVKTVCLYGSESTGKSTLTEQLAAHYKTVYQTEWAREYLGNRHCCYEDMQIIAENHYKERQRLKGVANKVMIVDSDTITTKVYSQAYYGQYPSKIDDIINLPDNQNDLYLLCDIDVPWVQDGQRDFGSENHRKIMHYRFTKALEDRQIPYVLINGTFEERLQRAIAAIDEQIFKKIV